MPKAHPARRSVVYHIMLAGRRHVAAASTLIVEGPRVAVQLDPEIVGREDVFLEIDPKKLRPLDEEGWVYGYPELVDRRRPQPRRTRQLTREGLRPRGVGRRASDKDARRRV
jgi:hypothetical protein